MDLLNLIVLQSLQQEENYGDECDTLPFEAVMSPGHCEELIMLSEASTQPSDPGTPKV